MKVLHLATYDNFGGASRAAYRQHLALLGSGLDSRMLVRYRNTSEKSVHVFVGKRDLYSRTSRSLRRHWINWLENRSYSSGGIALGGLTDPRADLLREPEEEISDADVINIHKTEHFIDLPALLRTLPPTKPVVITLHDLSPITGGCDYPGNCDRFTVACGCCPAMDSRNINDYSNRIFRMKQSAYAARPQQNFAFTANSRWTAERFRQSALVAGRRVELIHYGLDQSVYHPRNREAAREALGIGKEEAVVCFAAHDLSYYRKGGHKLSEALLALKSDRSIRLLTMGGGELAVASQYNHTHFHQINSDHLQGLIYRASDVFVIPSLEEAFGQTALEAIACGTVVAGFKVGGIVDIVQIGLNGQLANPGQSDALCQAIGNLLENSQLRDEWKEHCFNWVSDHFSFSRNAASYIRLYESLLNVQSGN